MDRVVSTRMDESVIPLVNTLVFELGLSKKAVFEMAVRDLWERTHNQQDASDIYSQTFGLLADRPGSIDSDISKNKAKFRKSFERHRL